MSVAKLTLHRLLMNAFTSRASSPKSSSHNLWLLVTILLQVVSAGLTPSASAQSLPSFTKLTSSAVAAQIGTGVSCAWADYDNDGYPDLLVLHFGPQTNQLFHNNRDGTFTKVITGHLVSTPASTTGSSFGDYDGDGYLDLFITVEDGPSLLYHNDGGTNFTLVTNPGAGTLIAPSDGRASGAAWADYNRDGYLDLFVIRPNVGGTNTLYRNNGNGTFTIATPGAGAPEATIGGNNVVGFCSWVDVDNDGWPDLFIGGNGGALYQNLGGTNFLKLPSSVFDLPGGRSVVGGSWGDYDGDGLVDLVLGFDGGASSLSLYRNQGGGSFTKVSAGDLGTSDTFASTFPVWADANNDGFMDLFVGDAGGVNKFYRNNGNGTFTLFTSGLAITESGSQSLAAGWADFNRDGWLDLFVNNGSPHPKFLYQNNGGANAWLAVQCGRLSANTASAIGATVRVQARIGGVLRSQTQQLFGGDGRRGPRPLVAHFGLGDATTVETLVIEWPGASGGSVTQTWSGLDVRQHLAFPQSAVTPPIIFAQPASAVAASLPTNVVLTVSASGTPPLFYQWHSNGIPIAGANLVSLTLPFSVPAPPQNYTVVITNVNGASTSSIAQVTFPGLDTDRDGLPDVWEVQYGLNPSNPADALSFPVVGGVTNKLTYLHVYQLGLDTRTLDFDNDGVTDYDEIFLHGTDPKNPDTDGDGLPDGWEVQYRLNPRLNDANDSKSFDGVTNLQKYQWNLAHPNAWEQMYPNRAFSGTNTISDYERFTGIRTSRPVYDRNDRLTGVEYSSGVSLAYIYDGNGNLIRQKWLSRASETNGLPALFSFLNNLTNSTAANGPYGDADGDGWSNVQEFQAGTNPNSALSKPDAIVNAGTNIAELRLPFTPTNFVMGVGQLDGLGAEEIVIGADGNPGTNTNFILILSQSFNGWATQRVDVGAFGVTSIGVGRPMGRTKGAIYCGVRGGTGSASIVELSLVGTNWQTATVAASTNGDAFVLGVMNDSELVVRYSPSNGPSSSVYALTPMTNSAFWTGYPLLTNGSSFDSGLLQETSRGSGEWLVASRAGTTNISATTLSPLVAASLQDNFDRPDGLVGNGWQFLAGQAVDNYGIKANKLSGVGGLMFRPALLTTALSISGELTDTVGYQGPSRYDATFAIRSDGTYASGYGIGIGRSDAGYANSGVNLFDGDQSIASQPSSFQFSGTLAVTASFFANGSVTGTVASGGNSFSFSFPARAINSVGQFFRYTQASSASKPQTLDNFTMSYTERPVGQYVLQQPLSATNLHQAGRRLAASKLRNGATTTRSCSLIYAVIADANGSGVPDAGDEFAVTEYPIPPSTNLTGTVTRIPLSGNGLSSHFGIATVELIPHSPPFLFTAEPDGQVFSWQEVNSTGALGRHLFNSNHLGKAWHALTGLKVAEPGEGLIGLRVDPTNPATCSVFFWPPQQTMAPPPLVSQTAPSVLIYPSTNASGSLAQVSVRLWDHEGNASLPMLEFQAPGSTIWSNATVVSVDGQAVGRVAALPTGSDHTLLWNAGRDLGAGFTNTVLLRARASDITLTGDYSATVSYRVEVSAGNPVANPDSTNTLQTLSVDINVLANDTVQNGRTPSVLAHTQPANGSAALNANQTIRYTPRTNFLGADSFNYTLSDGAGGTNIAVVTVTVVAVNHSPSPQSYALSTAEEAPVTFPWSNYLDADGDLVTLLSIRSPSTAGGSVTLSGGAITYTPATNFFGTDTFTFVVQDNGLTAGLLDPKQATNTVTVTVTPVNDPPTLTLPTPTAIVQNTSLRFADTNTITVSDFDAGPSAIQLHLTVANGSLTFGITNGLIFVSSTNGATNMTVQGTLPVLNSALTNLTWQPTSNFFGADALRMVANDLGNTGIGGALTANVSLPLLVAQQAIIAPLVATQPQGQTVGAGSSVAFGVVVTGTAPFSYQWQLSGTNLPGATNPVLTITNVLTLNAGNYRVQVSNAATAVMSDVASLTVLIPITNSPPALMVVGDQTVVEGSTLVVTNRATDTDLPAQVLTFILAGAPIGATINPTNGVFTWTPTEFQGPSTNTITVLVTDNGTPPMMAVTSFRVEVMEFNTAPSLALSNTNVVEGITLVLAGYASDVDWPPNTLTYSLLSVNPGELTLNATNGVITWTPTEAQGPGSYSVTVRVADNGIPSLSATQMFTVNVTEANSPPVLGFIPNQTVYQGETVVIPVAAVDSDLPANQLTFTLISAPTNASFTNNTFVWRPTAVQADVIYPVGIVVTDNGLPPLSATQTFQVTVNRLAQLSAQSLGANRVSISVSGRSNVIYTLEASTNLLFWQTVLVTNSSAAVFEVIESTSPAGIRIYRIREQRQY